MKKVKIILIFALTFVLLTGLLACTNSPVKDVNGEEVDIDYADIDKVTVLNPEVLEEEGFLLDTFDYSQITVVITYLTANKPATQIPLQKSMVRATSQNKLKQAGTYLVEAFYGRFDFSFRLKLYRESEVLYRITFYDETGDRLIGDPQYLRAGALPIIPTPETKDGYVHKGWVKKGTTALVTDMTVNESVDYVASYEQSNYTVRYYSRKGEQTELIRTETIAAGGNALDYAPEIPVFPGYSNGRWSDEEGMKSVGEGNTDFYAVYDVDTVLVTFSYYKYGDDALYDYRVTCVVDSDTEGVMAPSDAGRSENNVFLYWYILRNGKEIPVSFPYKVTGEIRFLAKYVSYAEGTENLLYSMNEGGNTYEITGMKAGSADETVVIPEYHLGRPVVSVHAGAFKDCSVKRFVVSASNTRFRAYDGALYNAALTELIAYPKADARESFSTVTGLQKIRAYAFYDADALKELTIAESVTEIGAYAFASCDEIISLTIPEKVTIISEGIAQDAVSLRSFQMNGNVTEIGDGAFKRAASLEKIMLPASVEVIGEEVFVGCKSLSVFETPLTGTRRAFNADRSSGALYRYNDTRTNQYYALYAYPAKYDGANNVSEFTLNASTAIVKKGAFADAALLGIYVPTVASVVFEEESVVCPLLQSVRFAGGSVTLHANTFGEEKPDVLYVPQEDFLTETCGIETEVYTGDSPYRVFSSGFAYVLNEQREAIISAYKGTDADVVIPSRLGAFTVVGIADETFANDPKIRSVVFPDTLVTIGEEAFYGCSNLVSVQLGDNVKSVGERAFAACGENVEFVFDRTSIEDYGAGAFVNCASTNVDENGVVSVAGVVLGTVAYNKKLIIPANATIIAENAFRSARFLNEIDFSQSDRLTRIGERAFEGCEELTGLVIPASLKIIEERAFADCVRLALPQRLPEQTAETAFDRVATVSTPVWETAGGELIRYNGQSDVVVFPNGITTIDERAFEDNDFIQKVILSDDIVAIGERAFYDCSRLESVVFGANVRTVETLAFGECSMLSDLNFTKTKTFDRLAYDAFDGTVWLNEYVDDSIVIKDVFYKYIGDQKELHIMNAIRVINDRAFYQEQNVDVVYFPASVALIGKEAFAGAKITKFNFGTKNVVLTEIRESAFENCRNLAYLDLRTFTALETIGTRAFAGISGNALNIVISASVREIGEQAFRGSEIKTVRFEDGSKLETIRKETFARNAVLESVIFDGKSSLYTIEESAFESCDSLKVFTNTNGKLESIGINAFRSDSELVSFKINDGNLVEVGDGAFGGTRFVEENNDTMIFVGTVLVQYKGTLADTVTIPAYTTVIGSNAFSGNHYIRKIEFASDSASKLEEIQEGAFYGCTALTDIVFPTSVKTIRKNAFYGCSALSSLDLNVVETLEYGAFGNCDSLVAVVLPTGLKTFGGGVFEGCDKLVNISIADGSTYCARDGILYAFSYSRIDGVNVRSATLLAYPSAKLVTGNKFDIPESIEVNNGVYTVMHIGDYAFARCKDSVLNEIGIHEKIVSVGKNAFAGIQAQIVFADGIEMTRLGDYAFAGYLGTEILIPESVEEIGENAFEDATNVHMIEIPHAVRSIGSSAFSGTDMEIRWDDDPQITALSQYAFLGYMGTEIVVPRSVTEIGYVAFGDVTAELRIEAALTKIDDYAFCGYAGRELVLPETVQEIGEFAFGHSYWLSLVLPAAVVRIGQRAFEGVRGVVFEQGSQITVIGKYAFANYEGTSLVLPESVTKIDDYAFWWSKAVVDFSACTHLNEIGKEALSGVRNTEVRIGSSVESIGDGAFASCSRLRQVTFTEDSALKTLGKNVFEYCNALTEITLPFLGTRVDEENETVENNYLGVLFGADGYAANQNVVPGSLIRVNVLSGLVNANAFYGCSSLKSIVLSGNIVLYENAFVGCNSLEYLEMAYGKGLGGLFGVENESVPRTLSHVKLLNIETLENNAYSGCSNVSVVELPDSLVSIGSSAFYNCSKIVTLNIGPNVSEIGDNAFARCSSLEEIKVDRDNRQYVDDRGVLYAVDRNTLQAQLIVYPQKKIGTTYRIALRMDDVSYSITKIAGYAFYYSTLTTVDIPETVASIGDYAFYYAAITSARLCTDALGRNVFNGCKNLKTMYLDHLNLVLMANNPDKLFENVNVVGISGTLDLDSISETVKGNSYVLNHFDALQSENANVSVEENGKTYLLRYKSTGTGAAVVKEIPIRYRSDYATVTVENKEVTDYVLYPVGMRILMRTEAKERGYVFVGWYNGGETVSLQSEFEYSVEDRNVVLEAKYVFLGDTAIADWYIEETAVLPQGHTYYLLRSDNNALQTKSVLLLTGDGAIQSLGENADAFKESVTTVLIGQGVTEIGEELFAGFISLEAVYFGTNLQTIGDGAFRGCERLKAIDLGQVITVGNEAFADCVRLEKIEATHVETIGSRTFASASVTEVTLPATLRSIGNGAFENCLYLRDIYVDRDNETFVGIDGVLYYYNKETFRAAVALFPMGRDGSYEIPASIAKDCKDYTVSGIDAFAFYGCAFLTEVYLSENIQYIGDSALKGCVNLREINIPIAVQSIKKGALDDSGIENVLVEEGNTLFVFTENVVYYLTTDGLNDVARVVYDHSGEESLPETITVNGMIYTVE